jgi:hypothetical protein
MKREQMGEDDETESGQRAVVGGHVPQLLPEWTPSYSGQPLGGYSRCLWRF